MNRVFLFLKLYNCIFFKISENIIAFDKPYQMAYASGPKDQAQMDRFLQHLKKKLCPDIDRLYLLSPLDKYCTGVILFAKYYFLINF
jgi:23S rRNA-/tRNA-specific pseudouridylate synthase